MTAMVCLIYWCGCLGWADRLARAGDPAAMRLAPGDADIRLRLVGNDVAGLQAAAALDPGNADAWIRLGLAAEIHGDDSTAELALLEAARVSRQYAPRWTLANYYFRRGDRAHFWTWMSAALRMGYGELDPAFALCWSMSRDGAEIRRLAIPERAPVLNAYVRFLLSTGRLAASEPIAASLAARGGADDLSTLGAWLNLQLDRGSVPVAVTVWNTLCARRLLPYAAIDTERAPLTDGDFGTASPVSGGFAWRLPPVNGAAVAWDRRGRWLRIDFSGDQPEACAPLLEYVPLRAGRIYRLRFTYRTAYIAPASGLSWSVYDARTGVDLAQDSPFLSSDEWKPAQVRFRAPACGLVRVTLVCRRVSGQTRIAGWVELRAASMEPGI